MQKFWFLKSWKPKFPLENKVKRRRRQPKLYLNLQNNFEKALIWLKLFLRKNLSVFFFLENFQRAFYLRNYETQFAIFFLGFIFGSLPTLVRFSVSRFSFIISFLRAILQKWKISQLSGENFEHVFQKIVSSSKPSFSYIVLILTSCDHFVDCNLVGNAADNILLNYCGLKQTYNVVHGVHLWN